MGTAAFDSSRFLNCHRLRAHPLGAAIAIWDFRQFTRMRRWERCERERSATHSTVHCYLRAWSWKHDLVGHDRSGYQRKRPDRRILHRFRLYTVAWVPPNLWRNADGF